MLTVADIINALTEENSGFLSQISEGLATTIISEAAIDSRQVIPAAMFVAIKGENTDGHQFITTAFDRGATMALIEREEIFDEAKTIDLRTPSDRDYSKIHPPFCILVDDSIKALQQIARYWRRQLDVKVIGITGSVGKSTTKELVASILRQRYHTLKNPGNLNNEIGLPMTILQLGKGHQRAVMEMGFYVPGEIEFLCDLALPSIGVVTSIGSVHAERAGSIEAIARGKAELVQALPTAPVGTAILNYDDPWVVKMAGQTSASVFYYGLDPKADLWADEIEGLGLEGIRFRLHYRDETYHLRIPLIGQHSVHTALRAAAVGFVDGLSWQEIIVGLKQSYTQLRLVAVHTPTGALVLDDTYNATPESTLAALNLLNEISGKKIGILGDMLELGQYEKQGHEIVGHRAAEVCDELITVGPISKAIAQAARNSGLSSAAIHWFETVPEVISFLQPRVKENDILLVKGSHGLRMDRIVSALEINLDEEHKS